MLYIIRHGQTNWNLENRIQGQYDIPLNETGRAQAHATAEKLVRFAPEHIISSDLSRAMETAQIVGDRLHITVDYDARLREYDFGSFTGLVRADIEPIVEKTFFVNPTQFGAESMQDAFARVGAFLQDIDYSKNTLVVTHGGVINFALCYLEDKNNFDARSYLDKCLHTKIKNASILRISDLESGMSVLKNTRFFKLPKSR